MAIDFATKANRVLSLTLMFDRPSDRDFLKSDILFPAAPAISVCTLDWGYYIEVVIKGYGSGASIDVADIDSAKEKKFTLISPTRVTKTLIADFVGTGSDGEIQAEVTEGIFDEVGNWTIAATVVLSDGVMTTEPGIVAVI